MTENACLRRWPVTSPKLPEEIRADGLIIHRVRVADAPEINEAVAESFAELTRWMDWARAPQSLADTEAFCRRSEASYEAGDEYSAAFRDATTARLLGCIGMPVVDWTVPKFEVGYWCRTSEVGNGFVRRATRGLTRDLFERCSAARVELRMDASNKRSEAVAVGLGFRLEGKLARDMRANDGTLRDTLVYAMHHASQLR